MDSATRPALTSFNPGSGCGCKIAPNALREVIDASGHDPGEKWPTLLLGHESNEDAAVMDLGNGNVSVHTTDFFTPIVDDPFEFGQIAAANAISDVYAMGARPDLALAILCWPLDKLPAAMAGQVLAGARATCAKAGIPLAGGHSIDVPQPIFGLSVTGRCRREDLKTNGGAQPGDLLYVTKPLGIGIVATAMKKGLATEADHAWGLETMSTLNTVGAELPDGVHALTDVTGFGLAGHLHEMLTASDASAELEYASIPSYDKVRLADLYAAGSMPQGTTKNYVTYYPDITPVSGEQLFVLFDPQTSGGLLLAVAPEAQAEVEILLSSHGLHASPIGRITAPQEKKIIVQ